MLLICSAPSILHSEQIFQHTFSNNSDGFSSEGRISLSDDGLIMRGGLSPGALVSPLINTGNISDLKLTLAHSNSRFDSNDTVLIQVSTNGGSFNTVQAVTQPGGTLALPIPASETTNSIRIRIASQASSYFETYSLNSLTLSGSTSETPDNPDNPGEPEDPNTNHTVILPDSTWTCGLPQGIPQPESGELLFTASLSTDTVRDVGLTPYGLRTITPVNGGRLQSGSLSGSIDGNALDWDLDLPSGAREHESRYVITTSDGTLIYMRNCGVADGDDVRFVADFEAPSNSRYAWLNQGTYVGTRSVDSNRIQLAVHANPKAQSSDQRVKVLADNDVRQQTWECPAISATLQSGDEILEARVNIGGFQTVGNSKYGSRRIIPITGGTFTGNLRGDVNPGGADFQLTRNGDLSLEARYTIQTSNGDWIAVRNCGDFANDGSLTLPIFETAMSNSSAWLNDADFVGTITPGLTRVTITVYERR